MRKWMRERLQRRKKKSAEPSDQPTPPPLQPAYFDAEQKPEVSDRREGQASASSPNTESSEVQLPTSEGAPSDAHPAAQASPIATSTGPASRSRRRRGGRGRGGRGREQAVAQAFSPAAVKGSIPIAPAVSTETVEAAEDDFSDAEKPQGLPAIAPTISAPPKDSASAVAPRAPKGVVVLAIGLPGSGKSTWFKRHKVLPLSSDMVRSLLFDDVREQRYQDLVFSNLRSMLKARLIARRPMNYVDATNLTPQERQHWIKLAKDYQYEVHAVFFDVPLEVCIERHQRRDRVVPEDVMRRMAAKLKPPTFAEGIAKITVVRVKKKEPVSN